MGECSTATAYRHGQGPVNGEADQFYSVEFSIEGIDFAYQFKIWNLASSSMCVLVREDSSILQKLRVGDVMNMKFYTSGYAAPIECLNTAIRYITKDEQGPFKGHYLVGLEIVEQQRAVAQH
jgi:hypothetical protein